MRKAKKKPVIVEFIQLKNNNIYDVYLEVYGKPDNHSCRMAEDRWDDYENTVREEGMKLKTPESGEGTQIASINDYIVFGESPELGRHCWPVKPDYFEKSYDLITE